MIEVGQQAVKPHVDKMRFGAHGFEERAESGTEFGSIEASAVVEVHGKISTVPSGFCQPALLVSRYLHMLTLSDMFPDYRTTAKLHLVTELSGRRTTDSF